MARQTTYAAFACALALGCTAVTASAAPTHVLKECNKSDVQITRITSQDPNAEGSTLPAQYPISASACLGVFSGNDKIGVSDNNLGFFRDGFLNEDNKFFGKFGAFLDEGERLDLKVAGEFVDPGWIYVGKVDAGGKPSESGSVSNGSLTYDFKIDEILKLTFTNEKKTAGTFTYTPPAQNPGSLLSILGSDKFFDQAAIILKASDSWAIYNFTIGKLGVPAVTGTDAFNFMFSGTFDLTKTFTTPGPRGNTPGLSHATFWLRDPSFSRTTTDVSAPGTALSLMLGLGLMTAARRRRAVKAQ